ncbi:FtsX-like permease family protein [Streptomyces sp. NPDC048172]|uniref:FtsX-like permease family protein n=1 Tax=Streptomyces sp. NPDC048172 TaxID=3365505 RepID=UPI00371D0351
MTGFIFLRVRAHRLLVAAAVLTVVLATSVLAALTAFSSAIGDAGLRRALQHQSAPRTVVDVRSDVTPENEDRTDAAVRKAAHRSFAGLPARVAASTSSESYALPRALRPADAEKSKDADLTRFASLDRARVRMTAGSWPSAPSTAGDGTVVEVAVPEPAAKRLKLRPGDTFRVTSRLSGPPPVRVKVTGVYLPRSPGSPYWRLDPLKGQGTETLDYTTYGPLTLPDGGFATAEQKEGAEAGLPVPAERRWQARADFTGLTAARVGELRDHVKHAVASFGDARDAPDAVATSELPRLLDSLDRTLLVTRSTLLIAGLQLVLLTGLALLLVAQLLTSEREGETALLRARGASRTRVCVLSALEALLLALPAALLAPLLAEPAVRQLTGHGALARAGVEPVVRLPAGSWWVAALTALGCAAVLVLPMLRRRGGAGAADPENGGEGAADGGAPTSRRRRGAVTALRGGADLALVGLAAVAYWQLERRADGSGVLSGGTGDGVGGALGIDPVLVAAPALALLAGTVLVLRLLPLAARLGERRATRGRGLAAALAGWQLSRRPLRGAGPALLLVLAVATGVFAVGQGASWDRSQGDQADFRTGADVAVDATAAGALSLGGLYDGVDGVRGVAPVARSEITGEGNRTVRILATDTRAAGDGVLRLRDDLADEPLPRLLRPLAGPGRHGAGAAARTGIVLPEHTTALRLRVRADVLREGGGKGHGDDATDTGDTLTLTLEDRYGVPYRFILGEVPADGKEHTLTVRPATPGGTPAGPLRVTRLNVAYPAPPRATERRLTVASLRAEDRDGETRSVHPRRAERWRGTYRAEDPAAVLGKGPYDTPRGGTGHARRDGPPLEFRYGTGSAPEPAYPDDPAQVSLDLVPAARAAASAPARGKDAPLSVVATEAYLRAGGAKVGDRVKVQISGAELTARIAGSVRELPTVGHPAGGKEDSGALLFDLAALDRTLLDHDSDPLEPDSWWLSTRPGAAGDVARELRGNPAVDSVRVRDELASALRDDPLGAGPRSALTAITLAAAALAATGFAVSTAGAARERAGEFAVLRALGASRRRLARSLAAEQGLLVLLSLALGLALGVLLTRLVVPLIVLTQSATRPVPELRVTLPPGQLALLLAAVVAVPLVVVAATALRRADPVETLRTERGE